MSRQRRISARERTHTALRQRPGTWYAAGLRLTKSTLGVDTRWVALQVGGRQRAPAATRSRDAGHHGAPRAAQEAHPEVDAIIRSQGRHAVDLYSRCALHRRQESPHDRAICSAATGLRGKG
jgi:hypothetical protein